MDMSRGRCKGMFAWLNGEEEWMEEYGFLLMGFFGSCDGLNIYEESGSVLAWYFYEEVEEEIIFIMILSEL